MKHVYFLPVCALLLVACSENESEADVQTGCYSASFTEASSSAPNDGAEDFFVTDILPNTEYGAVDTKVFVPVIHGGKTRTRSTYTLNLRRDDADMGIVTESNSELYIMPATEYEYTFVPGTYAGNIVVNDTAIAVGGVVRYRLEDCAMIYPVEYGEEYIETISDTTVYDGTFDVSRSGRTAVLANDRFTFEAELEDGLCRLRELSPAERKIGVLRMQ